MRGHRLTKNLFSLRTLETIGESQSLGARKSNEWNRELIVADHIQFSEIFERISTGKQVFASRFERLRISSSSVVLESVRRRTSHGFLDERIQMRLVGTRIGCILERRMCIVTIDSIVDLVSTRRATRHQPLRSAVKRVDLFDFADEWVSLRRAVKSRRKDVRWETVCRNTPVDGFDRSSSSVSCVREVRLVGSRVDGGMFWILVRIGSWSKHRRNRMFRKCSYPLSRAMNYLFTLASMVRRPSSL